MKQLIIIIAVCAVSCTEAANTATMMPGIPANVVAVTDGDSLLVEMGGVEQRVRLIGINAPEYDECFGDESAAALRSLVDDTEVGIVADVEATDQYGRLLGYVYRDGVLINEEIARRGYALSREYEPNTALQERIAAAARDAQDSRRGMWAPGGCVSEFESGVTVLEVEADPPGRDEDNLRSEWVVLAATGDAVVDLTGWTLRDGSSAHRYAFPAGTRLVAGSDLIVSTGCGTDGPGRLYWCADGPVWDNSGDTAILLDAAGRFAATFDY